VTKGASRWLEALAWGAEAMHAPAVKAAATRSRYLMVILS
jgi:hypothetical protein